jgi:CRISPR-associated protein Cas2
MDILVTYDVNTETAAGRRRLRKVAEICQDFGQRVQFSVFECSINEMQLDQMIARLNAVIDSKTDSVRFYRLPGGRTKLVTTLGLDIYVDLRGPLVV